MYNVFIMNAILIRCSDIVMLEVVSGTIWGAIVTAQKCPYL